MWLRQNAGRWLTLLASRDTLPTMKPVQNDVDSEMNISAGDSMVMVDSAAASVKVDPSYRVARLKSAHTSRWRSVLIQQ